MDVTYYLFGPRGRLGPGPVWALARLDLALAHSLSGPISKIACAAYVDAYVYAYVYVYVDVYAIF